MFSLAVGNDRLQQPSTLRDYIVCLYSFLLTAGLLRSHLSVQLGYDQINHQSPTLAGSHNVAKHSRFVSHQYLIIVRF